MVDPHKDSPTSAWRLWLRRLRRADAAHLAPVSRSTRHSYQPVKKELQKGEYLTYKLRNVPTDVDSPGFELSIPYFSSGTCEEWLLFLKNIQKVLDGQGSSTGPALSTVARRLLDGKALATFENAAEGLTETMVNFKACLDAVTRSVFPARAVLFQKH